jgi:hypothetical protein
MCRWLLAPHTSRHKFILGIKTAPAYVSLVVTCAKLNGYRTVLIKTSVADPDPTALACKSPFEDLVD